MRGIAAIALSLVLLTGCAGLGGFQQDVVDAFGKADAALAKGSNEDGSGVLDGSWSQNAFTSPVMDPLKTAVGAARLLVSSIGQAVSNGVGMVDGVVGLFTGGEEEE